MASVDLAGWVTLRDLTDPETILATFKPLTSESDPDSQETAYEIGNICFNNGHQLLAEQVHEEEDQIIPSLDQDS